MKRVLFFFSCWVLAMTLNGQGVVDFNNNRTFATAADRLVYDYPFSNPLVGTNYVAQLYYGADPSSLQAVTTVPARFRVVTTTAPGTWSGGNRTLTGFGAGTTVTLQVAVWDSNMGSSLDQVRAAGGFWGQSAPFTYVIPPAGSPPAAFYMENFRSFMMIPEPSVIALGLLGGALLLGARRLRK